MAKNDTVFAYGTLCENGDTWLLIAWDQVMLVDSPSLTDLSLMGKTISLVGKMGIPHGTSFAKLIATRIVSHDAISLRALEIYQSGRETHADENWYRAEKELLGLSTNS
jgi:hypothetical protein